MNAEMFQLIKFIAISGTVIMFLLSFSRGETLKIRIIGGLTLSILYASYAFFIVWLCSKVVII